MPQLMPLNWMMSIFMFFLILVSISWIFSVKKEMKSFRLMKKVSVNRNLWFW